MYDDSSPDFLNRPFAPIVCCGVASDSRVV